MYQNILFVLCLWKTLINTFTLDSIWQKLFQNYNLDHVCKDESRNYLQRRLNSALGLGNRMPVFEEDWVELGKRVVRHYPTLAWSQI